MPTLNINGQRVRVDDSFLSLSPEQQNATVDEIAGSMAQHRTPVAPALSSEPSVGVGEDAARSLGTGLRQGVEGLVGMWGDAAKMQGDIAGWAAGKLGASPETQASVSKWGRRLAPMPGALTTEEIQSGTTAGIGEHYQPQTMAGEYARTLGQFAPGAVAGPGTLARKTAMTIVPALASETAGQATKGTEAEPYARLVGGLAGGVAAAGRRPSTVNMAAKGAPSAESLREQSNRLYGALRDAGIRYDAEEYGRTVSAIAAELRKKGFRQSTAESAMKIMDDLAADIGKSPDFDDINGWISSIGGKARDLRKQGKDQEALAVDIIRDHLDDFERKAAMVSDVPLPAAQFDRLRTTARSTALRNIKSRALQEIVDKADTYQAGQEAGIRTGIGNLLRSRRGMQLFRGEERKALLEVAQGRKALRTLSRFGFDLTKVSGNATLLPAAGAAAAGLAANPLAGAGLAAAGTAAKLLSPVMTHRAFETASAAIRSGKANGKPVMDAVRAENLKRWVRALLAAESAKNSAVTNTPLR